MLLAALIPLGLFLFLLFYCTVIGTGTNFKSKLVPYPECILIYSASVKCDTKDAINSEKNLLKKYLLQSREADLNNDAFFTYAHKTSSKTKTFYVGQMISDSSNLNQTSAFIKIPALIFVSFEIKEKRWFSLAKAVQKVEEYVYSKWLVENDYVPNSAFLGELKMYKFDRFAKSITLYIAIQRKSTNSLFKQ